MKKTNAICSSQFGILFSLMLGVLGMEGSMEGPFSKNSKASYLINARYATLAALGSVLMLASQFYTFDINHYYIGTSLLLFGVWVNASFVFFYRQWIKPLLLTLKSKILNLKFKSNTGIINSKSNQ